MYTFHGPRITLLFVFIKLLASFILGDYDILFSS